ncbi:MAG: hypothetical protein M1830_006719 [Pleopsidium flavum]|nr:MAG: hypothetical protein M1830_006719 [Pleopsidium flavum]
MQDSRKSTFDQIGGKSRSQSKRKLSQQSLQAIESHTPQRSIADLLGGSTKLLQGLDVSTHEESPSVKRVKYSQSCVKPTSPSHVSEVIPPEKMYNFPSSSSKSNNVIDLTTSPTASPSRASHVVRKTNGIVRPTNFTPHTGAKRLVVKNLRKTPRVSQEQYFDQVWEHLDAALAAIFNFEKVPHSLEELYRGVENLCRQDRAPEIYNRLSERCKQYVSGKLKEALVLGARNSKDVDVLRAVVEAWSTWNAQLTTIRSIFYYMDRSYLLHSIANPSIDEMGLHQFRSCIFSDLILKPKILQGACDLVTSDRKYNESMVDHSLLRQAINVFHALTVYTKDFEPILLGESQEYFISWADQESSTRGLASYVEECHKLIDRETSRCDLFGLDSSTRRELLTKLEELLIKRKEAILVKTESVSELLEVGAIDPLEQLYSLLQRQRLGAKLRPPFEWYINATGSVIVFDEERESDMVVRLLELKGKLDSVWRVAFHKHEGLGHSLREAFETFINKTKKTNMTWGTDNPKPGEMIAKYVDMLLRGGAKVIPATLSSAADVGIGREEDDADGTVGDEDAEISKQLDQVLDLFRFVHGKAVFEAFYKKDLARRLLMGRSASAEAEKSMLTRLKTECGAGFTHNLEQMFRDIDLARDEMASYKSVLEERQKKTALELSVNVLSMSAWPTYPDVPVNVPLSISKSIGDFDIHYKAKHTGRKLNWKHALAHCQLRASFSKGNKEIVVSSFQAIVLLLFNDVPLGEQMTYAEIQAATSLSDAELKRTLQSLACAKYRVLVKTPKGREVSDNDNFSVNDGFTDPKYRIKINQIQLKETREENKETHERVAADRHYETQAAIVRIMKSRKSITHAELVTEVIKATKSRGVLDPADIKKNIEK